MARLAVSVDSRASLVALQALSEVKLDAGGSSGTGLRYALDFGDGQGVDAATAQHIYLAGDRNRILDITVQNGRALQGAYTHPEGYTSPLVGCSASASSC